MVGKLFTTDFQRCIQVCKYEIVDFRPEDRWYIKCILSTTMTTKLTVHNVHGWIQENKKFFAPPVCNKLMHKDGQMKVMFVGGPNQRKDYHIDCGEELFYQIKGDMVLKIVEQGVHKDIVINEGEMFLLPALIQHSPQRYPDTMGLVLERERDRQELDGLRYFVENNNVPTTDILYEEFFYCSDLGTELPPIIKRFFESEQCKTGKPKPNMPKAPLEVDNTSQVSRPFSFDQWIKDNTKSIQEVGKKAIFDEKCQFQITVYGEGETKHQIKEAEVWIWQISGESSVTSGTCNCDLKKDDTVLIPQGDGFTLKVSTSSMALFFYQDPTKCATFPAKKG